MSAGNEEHREESSPPHTEQHVTSVRIRRPQRLQMIGVLLEYLNQQRLQSQTRRRKMWVHPIVAQRTMKGHFNVLYQDLRRYPEKFIAFCRLSIPAFDHLLSVVRAELTYEDTVMRKSISAEERLLITLRFLATGESYTSLHLQFRVGKSTISQIVRCTCTVIWQKLQPIVMPSPTEETWLQVAAGFQSVANFPNCIGAVDGKHVRVQQPPRSGSRFFNYKNTDIDVEQQQPVLNPVVNVGLGRPSSSGVCVRETFTDYFMSPEGAVHWQYSCVGDVQPDQQRMDEN
ncbi:uncharacterized protein LOC143774895 [Ranitomeya variabilis]|uniref:uncharacterized protein LOC143774895 n=1 Tax=Ranitomeya variabilis TaxID=490064 RepID=UPI00405746DA